MESPTLDKEKIQFFIVGKHPNIGNSARMGKRERGFEKETKP